MPENESRLTVYFEDPFWVGIYERVCDGALEAAKITFGAEPKDHEVYAFLEKTGANSVLVPRWPIKARLSTSAIPSGSNVLSRPSSTGPEAPPNPSRPSSSNGRLESSNVRNAPARKKKRKRPAALPSAKRSVRTNTGDIKNKKS